MELGPNALSSVTDAQSTFNPDEMLLKEEAMKRFRNEDGQVLVITVLCMGILIGALGMAIDVGVLFRARRNMQIAADAAAMAGATALFYGGDMTTAAKAAASNVDTGITSGMVTVTKLSSVGGKTCGTAGKSSCTSQLPRFSCTRSARSGKAITSVRLMYRRNR